jgi:hypothetical protein
LVLDIGFAKSQDEAGIQDRNFEGKEGDPVRYRSGRFPMTSTG